MRAIRPHMLQFLQHDDIRVMPFNFLDRRLKVNRGVIRIRLIPHLPKLHVKLEYAQTFHPDNQRNVDEESFTTGNLRSDTVDFFSVDRTTLTAAPSVFLRETENRGKVLSFW